MEFNGKYFLKEDEPANQPEINQQSIENKQEMDISSSALQENCVTKINLPFNNI